MVIVNGKELRWEKGMTVADLLDKMKYTFPKIIVRVNGKVIKQEHWQEYLIPDQAEVQAHHLIAGG